MKTLLNKEKQPTRVLWECTMRAQIKNQDYNDQVNKKGRTRKMTKDHTPIKESVKKKRLNL